MDDEEKIMDTFNKMNKLGHRQINAGMITFATGIPKRTVYKKLKKFGKYNIIKKKRKTIEFYELI